MLAAVATAREEYREAVRLLEECLRLAPGSSRAPLDLVRVLHQQAKAEPMLPLLERLLAVEPDNPDRKVANDTPKPNDGEASEASGQAE